MSWVDRVIGIIIVIQAVRGRARGALVQLGALAGFVVGYLLGVFAAPAISGAITHARWRPFLALLIIVAAALVFSHLGILLGTLFRQTLRFLKVGVIDSIAGIAMGVAQTLLVCWLFAGLVSATSWGGLDRGIQQSQIIAAVDRVMPTPAVFEARVQSLFRYGDFPSVFASIVTPTLPGNPPRRLSNVKKNLHAPTSVMKVLASGRCASEHQGTAFFVGPHEAVTNAHVVAGATSVTVGGAQAVVVYFDPLNDIAVLRVPSLSESPATFLLNSLVTHKTGEVIGFPLNRSRTGSPAIVRGEVTAQARDIYDTRSFTRTVLVVNASVEPGSSGSPLFVGSYVVGVIFAKSYGQQLTAYAIPSSIVQHDLAAVRPHGEASTQRCLN